MERVCATTELSILQQKVNIYRRLMGPEERLFTETDTFF